MPFCKRRDYYVINRCAKAQTGINKVTYFLLNLWQLLWSHRQCLTALTVTLFKNFLTFVFRVIN